MLLVQRALLRYDRSDEFVAFFVLEFLTDYHFTTRAERMQMLFLLDRVLHHGAERSFHSDLNPFYRLAKACLAAFRYGAYVERWLLCFSDEEVAAAKVIIGSTRRPPCKDDMRKVIGDLQDLGAKRRRVMGSLRP